MISKACVLMLALVTGACNLLTTDAVASLTVAVNSAPNSRVRWPLGSGEQITLFNSLDDPRGLAGIEIEVTGERTRQAFVAPDFVDTSPQFTVPDSGLLTLDVRLVQEGRTVAEGVGSWLLLPAAEWRITVNRAPYSPTQGAASMRDLTHPSCGWFWCVENWRFPIAEDAANYEHEAIWVTLERLDECADVC